MKTLPIFIVTLLALICAMPLVAHPFDLPAPEIDVLVDVAKRNVRIEYNFRCDNIISSTQEQQNRDTGLDRDGDGQITQEELASRKQQFLEEILAVSALTIDGKPVAIEGKLSSSMIYKLGRASSEITSVGTWLVAYIFVLQSADGLAELAPGIRKIAFSCNDQRVSALRQLDNYRAEVNNSLSGAVLTPIASGTKLEEEAGKTVAVLHFAVEIPALVAATLTPPAVKSGAAEVDPLTAKAIRESQAAFARGEGSAQGQSEQMLRELLKDIKSGGSAMFWAFLAIFILGAWHALQPGHGKTLVASYLIGTHGRKRDALTLGVTVTAAHVSGVFLMLGLWLGIEAMLPAWRGQRQAMASGIIALAIGATIFLMGAGLLLKRAAGNSSHQHDIFGRHLSGDASHDHGDHHHDHGDHHHDHGDHSHDHGDHHHDHGDHHHDHGDHHHDHGDHHHDHGDHSHAHHDPKNMTTWQIIRLGMLGGLLPCPTAFAIALLTIYQGEAMLGLGAIVVFSLGLAVVLSAVGLVLVVTKGYLAQRAAPHSRIYHLFERYVPVLGALAIAMVGFMLILAAMQRLWGWSPLSALI